MKQEKIKINDKVGKKLEFYLTKNLNHEMFNNSNFGAKIQMHLKTKFCHFGQIFNFQNSVSQSLP